MPARRAAGTIRSIAATALLATGAAQAQQQTWVAVATDGRSNFGYAVGMATGEAAGMTALGECGTGCRLVLMAAARCVAYARSGPGNAFGAGSGATRDEASDIAWNDCNRRVPADSCSIRAAQCFE
ncbi:DUF4189 domain-containing protein [Reyranella sp.]|uniref:DUF4189 domain-containing protein n=1 Tax=Reyranella sp. TaxID=1929291 RepID=UPI0037842EA1